MPARVLGVAILVAVMAVVGACSASAPSNAQPTAGAVIPPGTYAATIPDGVNAAPGAWTLTVAPGGLTFTHPDGHTFSPGAVEELSATEIAFAPDPACMVQEGTPINGRYRWMAAGTSLTFEVIADSCQDRKDTLTSSDWSLRP